MAKFWASGYVGIALMLLATAAFVSNDTFVKLGAAQLPPFETLFIRGVIALILCVPLVFFTKTTGRLKDVFDPNVLMRNVSDFASSALFVVAITHMPIADLTALIMTSPVLLVVAAAVFFRERVGPLQWALIFAAFVGALMIAQPGGAGFSVYSLVALLVAFLVTVRDLLGRRVRPGIPGPIIAVGVFLVVVVFGGTATLLFEEWVPPRAAEVFYLGTAAFFYILAQLFVFVAFRTGDVSVTAPFYYASMVWAVISGALVFGVLPNGLAFAGMALVLFSGVAIAVSDWRFKRRLVTTLYAEPK